MELLILENWQLSIFVMINFFWDYHFYRNFNIIDHGYLFLLHGPTIFFSSLIVNHVKIKTKIVTQKLCP